MQLLARGYKVRAFARGEYPELDEWGVECRRGDLADRDATRAACAGMDVVFHVAALAGIWGKWSRFYDTNVLGTGHVIDGCRAHGVPKLIYTSSPSVTFDGRPQENVDERAGYPPRWLCHYSHTKALAEQEVLAAASTQLATCALRPHLIWGPGDRHMIPQFIARAREGRLLRVGDGKNLVDTTYVENAAVAHLQAADALATNSPLNGRPYFISQGEPVNCWQWINEILALAGLPPVRRAVSFRTAWLGGAVLEGLHHTLRLGGDPRMTRFLAAQMSVSHYYDIARARRDFGYEPAISMEEGMRRLAPTLTSGSASDAPRSSHEISKRRSTKQTA
jgi:nucleoside-diphosphate-sugar epimerase